MTSRKRTPPAPSDSDNHVARESIIGAGLREIRERLGATTYELAACVGTVAQVNARETGTVTLDRDTLREHLAALVLLASRPQ